LKERIFGDLLNRFSITRPRYSLMINVPKAGRIKLYGLPDSDPSVAFYCVGERNLRVTEFVVWNDYTWHPSSSYRFLYFSRYRIFPLHLVSTKSRNSYWNWRF